MRHYEAGSVDRDWPFRIPLVQMFKGHLACPRSSYVNMSRSGHFRGRNCSNRGVNFRQFINISSPFTNRLVHLQMDWLIRKYAAHLWTEMVPRLHKSF